MLYFKLQLLWTNFIIMCCLLHSILFFNTKVTSVHNYYNTRFAPKYSYYFPSAGTNYGKFHIHFQGLSVRNSIDYNVKWLSSISVFKKAIEGPIKMLKDSEFLFPETKSRETLRYNKILIWHITVLMGKIISYDIWQS